MARILVIDDDAPTRHLLRQMLERAGYDVIDACNGREGLQRYQEIPADLVITDILMPEQEGLETIGELRRLSPEVQILAISGGGCRVTQDFLPLAEKLGAQRVLRKPISRQELLATVCALVPD